MRVPAEIVQLTEVLTASQIDYRIVGGQAAVLYGLREESKDWDIALEKVTPAVMDIMEKIGFTEIPDSEGKSWEKDQLLVDFVIGDGEYYPTIEQLGLRIVKNFKFVARSMMGYINWKDGESAFQKLEQYKKDLADAKLPKAVEDNFDVDWLRESALIGTILNGELPMLENVVKLASKMDEAGFVSYADQLDAIVAQMVAPPTAPVEALPVQKPVLNPGATAPVDEFDLTFDPKHKERAIRMRETRIFDAVMEKVTGAPSSMIHYYLDIMDDIKKLSGAVERAESMQPGSQAQIELKRKINDQYNQIFDPFNVSDPVARIAFIVELGKVANLVKEYMPVFNKGEFGEETIIENFVSQLKEKGYLTALNKAKKAI